MTDSNSVPDLIAKSRDGDNAARDELFQRCRDYIHYIARAQAESWIRTKVDASDIVQQTMLDAHKGFNDFRGDSEGEWLAWLRRIVRTNATDFVRHYGTAEKRAVGRETPLEGGKRGADGEPARIEIDAGSETPSMAFAKQEDQLRVAAALTSLSEDHREVIILRNLERLPFDEVAERMDRSRGAVQMLWARALKSLKEEIERLE